MGQPDEANPLRKHVRLPGYDYSTPAAYFVTICVDKQRCLLGSICKGELLPSESGQIAHESWTWLEQHFSYVKHDAWSLMPNHLHGILCLFPSATKRKPLGQLIGAFKTVSTKKITKLRGASDSRFWQRGFYEHVIRSDADLNECRAYIEFNRRQWELDHGQIQPYHWE